MAQTNGDTHLRITTIPQLHTGSIRRKAPHNVISQTNHISPAIKQVQA